MEKIEKKLVEASANGTFLKVLYNLYLKESDERADLGNTLSELHNAGTINLLFEFSGLKKNSPEIDFFLTRHLFEDALPNLISPVFSVIECVNHLFVEAGDDLAAGTVFKAFMSFCEREVTRPTEVLEIVKQLDKFYDFISPAMIVGSKSNLSFFVREAIFLSQGENIDFRIRAIFALGRIDYKVDLPLAKKAMKVCMALARNNIDDQILSVLLSTSFSLSLIYRSNPKVMSKHFQTILKKGGDYTLYEASKLFAFNTAELSSNLIDNIIGAFNSAERLQPGILKNIDFGIQSFLKSGNEMRGIDILEILLCDIKKKITINTFDITVHYLTRGDAPILNRIVTKWFLSRNLFLSKAVKDIVNANPNRHLNIELDKDQYLQDPRGSYVFLTMKAVGWLSNSPLTALSFIVSFIEYCNESELNIISKMLFYPLLVSYPIQIMKVIQEDVGGMPDKTRLVLTNLQSDYKKYISNLCKPGQIPELLPTNYQVEISERFFRRKFSESYKVAQKDSLLNLIGTKSVLLYGTKTIDYYSDSAGNQSRKELELHKIEHSFEVPRLELLDPHGIDYLIRQYRIEGCEYETNS
ncbi:MAG: hypothetical protein M0P58_08320 [Bacteroidales bacterium]|nr:hypothetical protein [Bacteroidales bacterium]